MAVTAFREPFHNAGRMRRTMAILAMRHRSVLLLVAESACERRMLGLTGGEKDQHLAVTCTTVL